MENHLRPPRRPDTLAAMDVRHSIHHTSPHSSHRSTQQGVRLRPGYVAVRRTAEALQVGLDAPARAVVPDTAEVRRLLTDLEQGISRPPDSPAARRALAALADAGLIEPLTAPAPAPIAVEAPDDVRDALTPLVAAAGLRTTPTASGSTVTLIADDVPIARRRLDPLVRAGRPHLLVHGCGREWTVGPFVVPGLTACVRCVDAHLAQVDPRRPLVLDQLTRAARSRQAVDTVTRLTALCLAVADLRSYAGGQTPATWSATYTVGIDAPVRRDWTRHPHCGCAWNLGAG